MKNLLLFLVLLVSSLGASATTVTGTIVGTTATNLNNGHLIFTLLGCSTSPTVTLGGAPVVTPVTINLSGSAVASGTVVGTDAISCTGTPYYQVKATTSSNSLVWTRYYLVTGGSFTPTAFNTLTSVPSTGGGGGGSVVLNGIVSTGSYPDPSWITSLSASKLIGTITSAQQNNPAVGAKGGVEAKTCSGYNVLKSIGTDGVPVCSPDGNLNAADFAGATPGAQIDAACSSLGGNYGVVTVPGTMGNGWSVNSIPTNCTIMDWRINPGSSQGNFRNGIGLYSRVTSTNGGFSLPSVLLLEQDGYRGGVNSYPGGAGTKTQWQALRINSQERSIGERKGIQADVYTYGKGDSIGIMASSYDWGGYSTGGDEGAEGARFSVGQGFGAGSTPVGTVASVSGNILTGNWSAGTNAYLGEQRPVINLSRGVYSTGTLASGAGTAPFIITGSGTAWATAFGAGAKTDLFLEYTAFNGDLRFVIPVLSIVDDTHLTAEFNMNQFGATSFNPSGAYKIYKGGMVASLVDPPANNTNAIALNLVSGGSNFQFGDNIEQSFGYNFTPTGIQLALSKSMGNPSVSAGINLANIGSQEFDSQIYSSGSFMHFLRTGSNFSGAVIQLSGTHGPILQSYDTSAVEQPLIYLLSTGGAQSRMFTYNRPSDFWYLGGLHLSEGLGTFGFNTNPQATVTGYIYYNDATHDGFIIGPAAIPNAGKHIFDTQVQGTSRFQVDNTKVTFNNGIDVIGNSGNNTLQKWGVTGATGAGRFDGGLTTSTLEKVYYTDGFLTGSNTGGLVEAYAACPATGCIVQVAADIAITTPQTLTLTAGKPLTIKGAKRKISCSNTSGVCLKIIKVDGSTRDAMGIEDLTVTYTGASTGVTGLQIGDATNAATNVKADMLTINNFSTSSSVGLDLINVEDSQFNAVSYNNNTVALKLELATNQNQFSNNWWQANSTAIVLTDASENTFLDCLIQSNTGVRVVQMFATTINITGNRFKHCHFENNGDGTVNGRQIYAQAASAKFILRSSFENNTFGSGANVHASSYVYEFAGPGQAQFTHVKQNQYTLANISTGSALVAGLGLVAENDNITQYNVALDAGNTTGCDNGGTGVSFAPPSASKIFQIYGGYPGQFDSTLLFRDCSTSTYMLKYLGSSSTWDFIDKAIKTTNIITTGNGLVGAPAYSFVNDTATGMFLKAAAEMQFSVYGLSGVVSIGNRSGTGTGSLLVVHNGVIGFPNASNALNGAVDTAASRLSAGVWAFGNGSPNDFSGGIKAATGVFTTGVTFGTTATTGVQGNGAKVQLSTGSFAAGKCLEWDANGNVVAAATNASCGAGGGSGVINAGTLNTLAKYTGSTGVSNSSIVDDGTSITTTDSVFVLPSTGIIKFGDAWLSRVGTNVLAVGNGGLGDTGGTIEATAFQVNNGANGYFGPDQLNLRATGTIGFSPGSNATIAKDTAISRGGAGIIDVGNGTAGDISGTLVENTNIVQSANGAQWTHGQASELLTIAASATTDTAANLLPANSIIEAVVVRVVTTIPTAATFTVGDATTDARFATGVAVASTTTAVGLTHVDQTGAAGPKQTAAAKVRITPNLTPGAATGVVRITVFYRTFVAPTS